MGIERELYVRSVGLISNTHPILRGNPRRAIRMRKGLDESGRCALHMWWRLQSGESKVALVLETNSKSCAAISLEWEAFSASVINLTILNDFPSSFISRTSKRTSRRQTQTACG